MRHWNVEAQITNHWQFSFLTIQLPEMRLWIASWIASLKRLGNAYSKHHYSPWSAMICKCQHLLGEWAQIMATLWITLNYYNRAMHRASQEIWMLLDSTIVTMAVWITNCNKTYTTNSGGTAIYWHCIDRINDHMTQMQARVEACTLVATIFPFLTSFFSTSPPKYPVDWVQNLWSD